MKDYKEELHILQVRMEAEKAKGQQREELITELRSDKLQLRRQLTQMEELLKLQMEKKQEQKRELKQGRFDLSQRAYMVLKKVVK